MPATGSAVEWAFMHLKYLLFSSVIALSPAAVFGATGSDHTIEDAARASYNFQTVLDNQVKVKSQDGVVTLTGTVQDEADKSLATDTVENLPGVTSVRNDLAIKAAHPEKSDAWMAAKIRSRLLVKGNVSAVHTNVAVKDGVATLSGTADNAAQKELTGIYAAEIDGVKSVKNDLTVKKATATDAAMSEKIDDASITSQVKFALLTHKSTSALKTKVSTTDGVIHVTGEAKTDAEKALVTKLAQDVRGAKSVKNDMTVKT
jgi:hyperosmotically inducible periplasmic protein